MTIISLKIHGTDHYFMIPRSTVDKMLIDQVFAENYFYQVVKLSYFTQYPDGATVTFLQIRKRIPIGVRDESIIKLGYWRNLRILRNMRKRKDGESVDVIQKCLGVFGRWHLGIYLLLVLCKFPVGFHQLCIVFIGPIIKHNCADKSSHTYDQSVCQNTITMQWNLVCGKENCVKLAEIVTMSGIVAGNLLFGILSDMFGRKKMLVCEVVLQGATGLASAFIPLFWLKLVMRFLTGMTTGGILVSSFVLIIELIGRKRRAIAIILYQTPTSLSHALLALIGYGLWDWKMLQVAIAAPSLLIACSYWLLPESPRWLLVVGKRDLAVKVLKRGAKHNKLPTENIEREVDKHLLQNTQSPAADHVHQLLTTPVMRKYTLVICFNWWVVGLCFFGLSQYVSPFGKNIFLNVAFSGLSQIPGILFSCWCCKVLGRKWSLIMANLIIVACCLVSTIITPMVPYDCAIAVVGMFGIMFALSTAYLYSGELFPTTLRSFGVGLSSMSARIGSMVGPWVVGLEVIRLFLPLLIFGVFAMVSAFLCFLLPETSNCELPETVKDVERYEKTIKI